MNKTHVLALALLLAACATQNTARVDEPEHTPHATAHHEDVLEPDPFDAPAAISVAEATKASDGADEPPSGDAAVYTCPMDPEVVSDKPGNCPKCGMALVARKGDQ